MTIGQIFLILLTILIICSIYYWAKWEEKNQVQAIQSTKKLEFPHSCIACSSEPHKKIHINVNNNKENFIMSLGDKFMPINAASTLGKSVPVEICKSCLRKINILRYWSLLISLIFILIALVGTDGSNAHSDFAPWAKLIGASVLGIPLIYTAIKNHILKIRINLINHGYEYEIKNRNLRETLLNNIQKENN